jgi:hypothetical protein
VVPIKYYLRGGVYFSNIFSLLCDFLSSKTKNLKRSNETARGFLQIKKLGALLGTKNRVDRVIGTTVLGVNKNFYGPKMNL